MDGTLFWITGLSGAGKTTLSKLLYEDLKQSKENVVFFDGDSLREVLGAEKRHSNDERRALSMIYARLARHLTSQGQDVVMATISMFDETREWNRRENPHYFEVYLKVPFPILKKRRELYLHKGTEVVGRDAPFEEPKNPDLIIENDGRLSPEQIQLQIKEAYETRRLYPAR